jgi:hypothetical protein
MRIVLLLAAAFSLGACTPVSLEQGKRLAARYAADPTKVQFRSLMLHGRHVCGQMDIAGLTPYERALDQLDRGSDLLEFSATSLHLCGRSVASPAFETARRALSQHIGLAAIPRLDETPSARAEH